MLDNAEDARDVVQDAFLNAYLALDSYKGDSLFSTWLYRIAVNAAISLKRKNRVVLRIDSGGEEGGHGEPADESEASRPSHALERTEREQAVHRALNRLSPEHRTVLVL